MLVLLFGVYKNMIIHFVVFWNFVYIYHAYKAFKVLYCKFCCFELYKNGIILKKERKKERSLFPTHGIQGLYILTSSFFSNPSSHPPLASLAFSTGTLGHRHFPPLDVTHNCAFAYYALSSWNIHSSVSLFKSNLSLKVQIQYYDLPENFSPISPNRMHHLPFDSLPLLFPHFLMNLLIIYTLVK